MHTVKYHVIITPTLKALHNSPSYQIFALYKEVQENK